jgi:hypothetical protein
MVGMASPLVFAQPTIWSLWVVLLEPYWWTAGIISVALLALGLLLVWRRDLVQGEWTSLPVTFILALPMAYYIWDYDQVLLLFPWLSCWALAAVGDAGSARAWRYVLIAWVLILPLYALLPIPRGEQQTYGLLLPGSLLLLYGLARRQAEKATRAHTTAGHHQAVARRQAGGVS